MSDFYIGIYWYERQLTLREYADASRAFITQLRTIHPVFQFLEWVGDRPNNAVELAGDLNNLDALIYVHAKNGDAVYEKPHADGTPSWESFGHAGYDMNYSTGRSVPGGRVAVWIGAGRAGAGRAGSRRFANGVTIEFPSHENLAFPCKEFFDYDFLHQLMLQLVAFWRPEKGRLTSYAFSEAISTSMAVVAGWLTYTRDPRAAALRNSPALKDLLFETTPDGGTLISLGRTPISPENTRQVEQARRLRQMLIDERIVPG